MAEDPNGGGDLVGGGTVAGLPIEDFEPAPLCRDPAGACNGCSGPTRWWRRPPGRDDLSPAWSPNRVRASGPAEPFSGSPACCWRRAFARGVASPRSCDVT